MTCTDTRLLLSRSPEDCTIAEVAAVANHVFTCPDCGAYWKNGMAGAVPSEEEWAVGDRVFNKLLNDHEALDMILKVR